MTQVAMIFEEEKQEALQEAAKRFEKEKQRALEERTKQLTGQLTEQIVMKMLKRGDTVEEIVSIVPNYSQNDVEALRKKLEKKKD